MAEEDIIIKLRLQGQQELDAAFRKIDSSAKNLGTSFGKFGDSLKNVAKNLTLVTTAIIGVGVGLVSLTAKNAAVAEEIDNLSKKTGINAQELQVLRKITEDAGISGEAAGKALVKLTKNMQELKDPTSATSKELNELSPGLRRALLATTDSEKRFQLLRNVLAGTADETKAVNIAQLLLGKSGAELLPVLQLTEQEYQAQKQALIDLGFVLTATQNEALAGFDKAFDRAGAAAEGFGKQISAELAPTLTLVTNKFVDFLQKVGPEFLGRISLAVTTIGDIIIDFFNILANGKEVQLLDQRSLKIYEGFIKIKTAVQDAFTIAVTVANAFFAALDPIAKLFGTNGMALGIGLVVTQLIGLNAAFINLIKIGPALFKFFQAVAGAIGPALLAKFPQLVLVAQGAATAIQTAFLLTGNAIKLGIAKIIFEIQFAWLLALEKMGVAAAIFGGVLTKLRTAITIMWLALTGPIGLAVIGFSLLGAGIAFLIEKTIGWKNILNSIKEVISALGTFLGSFASKIGPAFQAAVASIKTFFGDLFKGIGDAFSKVIDLIKQKIAEIGASVKKVVDTVVNAITGQKNTTPARPGITVRSEKFGPGFAGGGLLRGPGTGTSDDIPIWGSNGEFMIKAASVKKFGAPFFRMLNDGIIPKIRGFANGGLIGSLDSMTAGMTNPLTMPELAGAGQKAPSGRALNLYLDGERFQTNAPDDVAKRLQKKLRKSDTAKPLQSPRWKQ